MKHKRQGSITVEAALVMPIIIIVMVLLYSLAIIQYSNVVTRTEAIRVASRVAMNWNTIGGTHDILAEDRRGEEKSGKNAINSESYAEHNPYRFFMELFTTGSRKTESMKTHLEKRMQTISSDELGMGISSTNEISNDKAYHLFNRYVEVKIDNTFSNPVLTLLDRMGFPVTKKYTVTAKAKITDPAEFVRNISFIQELLRKEDE